jgi:hypothetical protein
MRLPALIKPLGKTHCSNNCQFIRFHQCTARGDDPNLAEKLLSDGSNYLRTKYCRELASDKWQVIETCPKCKGRCEGERHSYHTVCTKCGTRFKRIEDQDEHYLSEDK